LLIFHISGGFQRFLNGCNVCIDVAFLYAELLEFFIYLNSFGNICIGIFESFYKVILKVFILLGIAIGQLLIYGLLLGISLVFNFPSMDVAKA